MLVLGDCEAYRVEFVRADGRTIALRTLDVDELAPVEGMQILHRRELESA